MPKQEETRTERAQQFLVWLELELERVNSAADLKQVMQRIASKAVAEIVRD